MSFLNSDNCNESLPINLLKIPTGTIRRKYTIVKIIFDTSGATKASKKLVSEYTQLAFEKLEEIKISDEGRESLKAFGKNLMERKF